MTVNKIFFDTALFIYALETGSESVRKLFSACLQSSDVMTSTITIMEYCTGCYKHVHPEIADRFLLFLQENDFEICNITPVVALEAAKIRGQYPYFKAMDALQLSSALQFGADTFYTNDKQLLQFQDPHMKVVLQSME